LKAAEKKLFQFNYMIYFITN